MDSRRYIELHGRKREVGVVTERWQIDGVSLSAEGIVERSWSGSKGCHGDECARLRFNFIKNSPYNIAIPILTRAIFCRNT